MMFHVKPLLSTLVVCTLFAGSASAQTVVYSPIIGPTVSPYVVATPPVVVRRPVTTYAPVVETISPRVVSYRTTTHTVAPPPVVTYSPPTTVVHPATPYGRPIIVSQKVYIPGQPIRNLLRAITP